MNPDNIKNKHVCFIIPGFKSRIDEIHAFRKDIHESSIIFAYDKDYVSHTMKKDKQNVLLSRTILENVLSEMDNLYQNYPPAIWDFLKILDDENKEWNRNIAQKLQERLSYYKSEISTLKHHTPVFRRQLLSNIPLLKKSSSLLELGLSGKGDTPVILIAAGPSLDLAIESLKERQKSCYIISCGTVFKRLISERIHPDIIAHLDPLGRSNTYLDVDEYPESTSLCYDLQANLKAYLDRFKKNYATCSGSQFAYWIANRFKIPQITGRGGSIANFMMNLAIYMKFKTIILIGYDFSYKDQMHADGCNALYGDKEFTREKIESGRNVIPTDDGRYTSEQLISFKSQIENSIRNLEGVNVINCSEGGLDIDGATEMKFGSMESEIFNHEKKIGNLNIKGNRITDEEIFKAKEELIRKIGETVDHCKVVLSNAIKALEDPEDIRRIAKFEMSWNRFHKVDLYFAMLQYTHAVEILSIKRVTYISDNVERWLALAKESTTLLPLCIKDGYEIMDILNTLYDNRKMRKKMKRKHRKGR